MPDFERWPPPRPAAAAGINWLLAILLILMAGYIWRSRLVREPSPLHDSAAPDKPVVARGDLAADEQSTIDLFKRVSPSVVHITTLAVHRDLRDENGDAMGIPSGSGSGMVWDQNGYIVTNAHVLETGDDKDKVTMPDGSKWEKAAKVTLADHSEWDARRVGVAPDKDIAVLKIEAPASRLRPVMLGTSTDLQVGQKVFVIGNPFGLDQTLTTGVISGLGREILSVTQRPIQGVIQTDAAINKGNSGGPLLDSGGRVIGVNTAIYSPSGASAGIGFAVPVDPIRWIVPQLIRHGKVEQIGLGVEVWDDYLTMVRLGLKGVLVKQVLPGSPAEKAGIRPTRAIGPQRSEPGDLIVAIDGKPIQGYLDMLRILDQFKAGDTVHLTVRRGDANVEVPVTLDVIDVR